ncbi:MAG: hypothetical protein AB7U73_20750 [Pirellulales bacterium]
MWTAREENLAKQRGLKFAIYGDEQRVTLLEVMQAWQSDGDFRAFFNSLLGDAPYSAFRWETPVASSQSCREPFEFVLLDSPGLASKSDPEAFAGQFRKSPDVDVVQFQNLGGDAILVVPVPRGPIDSYGHLAAFVRKAPEAQRHSLWMQVGAALERRMSDKPVWLSTAGAGVSWLHVRLDDRPKYYGYAPYRTLP